MRIACSRCQTRYEVPEEKLERGAVKVRCTRCGHTFVVRKRPVEEPPVTPVAEPEATEPAQAEPPASEPQDTQEASFDDFDFQIPSDEAPEPKPDPEELPIDEPVENPPEESEPEGFLTDEHQEAPDLGPDLGDPFAEHPGETLDDLPSLGELDLGDFEDLDEELPAATEPEPLEVSGEGLEPVSEDDLMPLHPGGQVQGIAEDMPHLDLQRGPRRTEVKARSPLQARDHRRSPLFWIVLLAVLSTGAYTAYNAVRHPEAFTFLSPSKIRNLWQQRKVSATLGTREVQGYYRNLAPGRRVFIIRGTVENRSKEPQSLVRVRGNLFGGDGATLASTEVYCGNNPSDEEIANLDEVALDKRLQNQVGDALSNVDLAPGARVPFVVVFPSPPEGVEKHNIEIVGAQAGSGF